MGRKQNHIRLLRPEPLWKSGCSLIHRRWPEPATELWPVEKCIPSERVCTSDGAHLRVLSPT